MRTAPARAGVLFCFVVGCAEFLVRKIMAVQRVAIGAFLELAEHSPMLDVRSPSEYAHAHIPGAYPLPLFTDEERKAIGTAYKQQSREIAIRLDSKPSALRCGV
jgi:hypothetical protein